MMLRCSRRALLQVNASASLYTLHKLYYYFVMAAIMVHFSDFHIMHTSRNNSIIARSRMMLNCDLCDVLQSFLITAPKRGLKHVFSPEYNAL